MLRLGRMSELPAFQLLLGPGSGVESVISVYATERPVGRQRYTADMTATT
jgi:hypothetical protein